MATAAKTSLLKSGFVNWFLDPKIKTFFQTQGYQNRWPIEAVKKAEKRFSLYLHLPDFYQVWKIAGQISRLLQEFKTLCKPRKWICIFSNFGAIVSFRWECRMWVNFPGVDFLEMVLRKKLGIFMSQSCSDLSKQCTYQNLLLFWCFQCGGHLHC